MWPSLLKFDMKIFVNVARLKIHVVVYSRHDARASVYFGHISSFFSGKVKSAKTKLIC